MAKLKKLKSSAPPSATLLIISLRGSGLRVNGNALAENVDWTAEWEKSARSDGSSVRSIIQRELFSHVRAGSQVADDLPR